MKVYNMITGASQGLGKALAYELAKLRKNLILCSLPNQELELFAQELKTKFFIDVVYFEFDLTNTVELEKTIKIINENYNLESLINNAGIGGTESLENVSFNYIQKIIQLNVVALSLLTKGVLANLKTQNKAYILNIASLAAITPIAYKTVYPASKSFIHSFSLGLSEELKKTSVSVSVVHPGAMKTNAEVTKRIEKQGILGKLSLLELDQIAKRCLKGMYAKKKIIVLSPFNYYMLKLLPQRISTYLISNGVKKEISF